MVGMATRLPAISIGLVAQTKVRAGQLRTAGGGGGGTCGGHAGHSNERTKVAEDGGQAVLREALRCTGHRDVLIITPSPLCRCCQTTPPRSWRLAARWLFVAAQCASRRAANTRGGATTVHRAPHHVGDSAAIAAAAGGHDQGWRRWAAMPALQRGRCRVGAKPYAIRLMPCKLIYGTSVVLRAIINIIAINIVNAWADPPFRATPGCTCSGLAWLQQGPPGSRGSRIGRRPARWRCIVGTMWARREAAAAGEGSGS